MSDDGFKIDMLGGNVPVQGEGTIDGLPWYFRARGRGWSFEVCKDPGMTADMPGWSNGLIFDVWHESHAWPDVGWIEHEDAEVIIHCCADLYRLSRKRFAK